MNIYYITIAMTPEIHVSEKCFISIIAFLIARYLFSKSLQQKVEFSFIAIIIQVLLIVSLQISIDSDFIPIKESAFYHYQTLGALAALIGAVNGMVLRLYCERKMVND